MITATLVYVDRSRARGSVRLLDEEIPVVLIERQGAFPKQGDEIKVADPGDTSASAQARFLEPLHKFS